MRIAQVAPLIESVPPKHYGGTERIVLISLRNWFALGHDVTLFASGDSVTSARAYCVCPRSLRQNKRCTDYLSREVLLVDHVMQRANEFDLIHFHTGYLHFLISRHLTVPHVTTLHGRLDTPELVWLYRAVSRHADYLDLKCPAHSVAVRKLAGDDLSWITAGFFRFHPEPGGYLAFLGRISPEKRVDRAIEIAKRVSMPLKIAAKVDRADRRYFKRDIEPLLNESARGMGWRNQRQGQGRISWQCLCIAISH